MDEVTVTIKGLDELQRTLEEMPKEVGRRVLRGTLKEAGEDMRQRMASMAPRDSGFLSQHLNVKVRVRGDELAGSAFVGPEGKVHYPGRGSKGAGSATGKRPSKGGTVPVVSVARFLEFGTSRMAARPFMRPAFEAGKDSALQKIIGGIQAALEKFRKRG